MGLVRFRRFRGLVSVSAILGVALAAGCSRQPPPHVGEWEAGSSVAMRFSEDGTVVHLTKDPGGYIIKRGHYKLDYSKDPIQLDVFFNDNTARFAIVRFLGENKSEMEVAYPREGEKRPAGFEKSPDVNSFIMTRKTATGNMKR